MLRTYRADEQVSGRTLGPLPVRRNPSAACGRMRAAVCTTASLVSTRAVRGLENIYQYKVHVEIQSGWLHIKGVDRFQACGKCTYWRPLFWLLKLIYAGFAWGWTSYTYHRQNSPIQRIHWLAFLILIIGKFLYTHDFLEFSCLKRRRTLCIGSSASSQTPGSIPPKSIWVLGDPSNFSYASWRLKILNEFFYYNLH